MADNNLEAHLVGVHRDNQNPYAALDDKQKDEEKQGTDIIVPLLLLVITGCGMCISGLDTVLFIYNIRSYAYAFIILVMITATYWLNHGIIHDACVEKKSSSYAELIHSLWGRKRGLGVQSLMAIHNILIIAYLQQRIAINAFEVFHNDNTSKSIYDFNGNWPNFIQYLIQAGIQYTDAFYYVAIANIPLILLALQTEFKKIRWFAIIGILIWIYLCIGIITEGFSQDSHSMWASGTYFFQDPDLWMLTSIGVLAYFMSSFQIIPYLHHQLKDDSAAMKKVINISSVASAIIVSSVFFYYLFTKNPNLDYLRHLGLVIITGCVTIINVLPTREFIVQILKETPHKQKTRDRFLTLLILTFTLFLSIFYIKIANLKVFLGLGTMLTGVLGFIFPAAVYFKSSESKPERKVRVILVLLWNILLGLTVFSSGIFMMMLESVTGNFDKWNGSNHQ